ncbi:hypothetical protein EYF80_066631 [Liparis tanakae]|uniref:Uncharacterized protein n=1 Tax=Liparis tanakae TaxID=230148 RepID=A0A4Z2E3F9_9TELE|nr:hypothetical protein EYF80_066631 [Liparis tanakae]
MRGRSLTAAYWRRRWGGQCCLKTRM